MALDCTKQLLLAFGGIAAAGLLAPVGDAQSLEFEVATVKPSQPGGRGGGIRPSPGGERYVASNVTLKLLMTVAYRVKASQISGGPAWIETDRFDMNAKAARPSSIEDLHLMLQSLLADRFKLQFHRQTKELPIYALTVDKSGARLQPHQAQSAGDPWIEPEFDQLKETLHAKFVPMDYFAWQLSLNLDRPVLDQTNLTGGYDFELKFTREPPPGLPEGALLNGSPIDTSGPTLFDALRQQLGLKLDRTKGPVGTIVIDHAEKPGEN